MTTRLHDVVVVDRHGLVHACAYCLPRPRLDQINRDYPAHVSHGMCAPCRQQFEQAAA